MSFVGREDIIGVDEILTGAIGLRLPTALGVDLNASLELLHILAKGKDVARRNWAPNKPDATIIGAPAEQDGFLSLQGGTSSTGKFLRTGVTDTFPRLTVLTIARHTGEAVISAAATRFMHVGSFAASGTSQFSLYSLNDTAMRAASGYTDGTTATTQVASATENPRAWGVRIASFGDYADDLKIDNMTAAASASLDILSPNVRNPNGLNILIGSDVSGAYTATGDVLLTILWSRILSLAEKAAAYDWGKRLAASVGVTV